MNLLPRIFLFLLFSLVVHAEKKAFRTVEFSVYGQYSVRGVGFSPVSEEAVAAGEKPQPPIHIETHILSRVGPYLYRGGDTLTFFNLETEKRVAQVRIPRGSDRWLLIFVRNPRYRDDPENQLMYLVYPFDDSLSNLPKDNLVFLNISGKNLDGLVEDKRMQIGHGESEPLRVQESLPLNLWAKDFSGERLLPALIKTYHFEHGRRYLILLFPPVLRGSPDLDVRFLADRATESTPDDSEQEL
jgi:hypothetical protein